ncbi:MAG: APC family permease [Acidobacteria bacterium]|nr:APC family permease [Acidobacteriota bacterium]
MSSTAGQAPTLRRALHLWDLVFYGLILIQVTAPMPLFGVVEQEARGHVVTTVLIGMFAMMFTALSYGRMARAYPSAGSAYTYVGKELHPALGYVTGWSMLMDYILNPIICTIWCSKAALNIAPEVPYAVWAVFFAALFTGLNLRGIRATARTNEFLGIAMGAVVVWVLVAATRYVLATPDKGPGFFLRPFYDPATFSLPALLTGTSVAVLTYIGFDAISTLSEEVVNPKRNILLATVLVCFLIGVLSCIEVYAGQLVWPAGQAFPDVDTAYVHVAGRAGGVVLFQVVNLTLLVATIGSGAGAQTAAARLLYGMGRDNSIPKAFFGALDPKTRIPRNNVLITGVVILAGAFLMTYQLGAELLNFGAFIGFMGVNVSSFVHYWLRGRDRGWSHLVLPLAGFLICLVIWLNLRPVAKLGGFAWLTVGIAYGAWKTKGFRRDLVRFEAPPE